MPDDTIRKQEDECRNRGQDDQGDIDRAMQSLAAREDNWTPPIVKTVATAGEGVAELSAAISNYQEFLSRSGLAHRKMVENWRERLLEMLRDAAMQQVLSQHGEEAIARYAAEIADHKRDPYSLIEEIVGSTKEKASALR